MGFINEPSKIGHPELIAWDEENKLLKNVLGCGSYYNIDELSLLKDYIERSIKSIQDNQYNIEATNEALYQKSINAQGLVKKQPKSIKGNVVYLAYDCNCKAYKIGTTKHIKSRNSALRTSNPYLRINYVTNGTYTLEAKLHEMFKNDKIRGEWFNLNGQQINQLIRDFGFKEYNDGK